MQAVILICLLAVLVFVIVEDLRHYRIRNEAVLVLLGLFMAFCVWKGELSFFMTRGLFASAFLVVMLIPYHLGFMGGGDTKLLAAAFLWIGPDFSSVFALMMLVFSVGYIGGTKSGLFPSRFIAGREVIPFSPSIVLAWITTVVVDLISRSTSVVSQAPQ